jgi:L-galactose dehydrogenase
VIYNQLGKTGLQVSKVGFGCAPLGNVYGLIEDQQGIKAVHTAIDRGVNFFDTSPYYGRTLSETRLGAALKGKRDKVVLATKGGRFDMPLETGFDFSSEGIMRMCEASLRRLQTDFIDVYQLHDIEFGDKAQVIIEAIPALHRLKNDGKVRFIGVTGYPLHLLHEMVDTQALDVILTYCHYNLMNNTLNEILAPIVKSKNVGLINASVTHMGILMDQGPPEWHPAPARVKDTGRAVTVFCDRQNANIAHLAIQYALQNRHVDVTLLGARTLEELEQSLKILDEPVNTELLSAVQEMIAPHHNINWPSGRPENYEPGVIRDVPPTVS